MLRLIKCSIIFFMSLTMIMGCGSIIGESEATSDMDKLFEDSDEEISNEIMDKIIYGINNDDLDVIKNIFSENAVSNSANIDNDIQRLCDFIDGTVISYEESDPPSSFEELDNNYEIKLIKSYYYIETDSEKYFVLIENYSKNTKQTEKQGVKCVIAVKADDRLKVFDRSEKILFDESGRIERYGIFIPDIYE
ncbi:MAG: DUF5104 domain-containing protein [Pseudobutyrivibrio sp.]|nr:DUF5104 domain-containing protein [Pseudobutyrivibrio sp.]